MIYFAVFAYAAALISANLIVAALGPSVMPILAFLLIGFDLSMRDWLHMRIKPTSMLALIAATGVVTYALNPAAGMIAVASAVAFSSAALVDWLTFANMRGSWMIRSNGSNVAGAAVDSILFPAIAFGLAPGVVPIIAMQFAAKVAGGAVWAWVINRTLSPVSTQN